MNFSHTQTAQSSTRDPLRPLRYVWRVPLLTWHIFIHLPITLTLIALGYRFKLSSGERLDQLAIRYWQAGLMWIFGFRVKRIGTLPSQPALFVANHCSWLDISLMHSQRALCFVAKSEIARWPVVGWVASRGGTIYHQRGSNDSLSSVSNIMIERLRVGDAVGVFPEGGTGKVDEVRTFHARIFQVCYDANVSAQPVALRYVRAGVPAHPVAFREQENFFNNFLRLLGEPATLAEVHFLLPVLLHPNGRRHMANAARNQIIAVLTNTPVSTSAISVTAQETAINDLDTPIEPDAGL